MALTVDAFGPARETLDWAEQAVAELDADAVRYFASPPGRIVTEVDKATGFNIQKVRIEDPIPKALRRRATEALTGLKHAFDQATFAAKNLTTGTTKKSVYFPWAANPTDLVRLMEARGIHPRLWDEFRRHEPYPTGEGYEGGNDEIRHLARLANDKHTVGLQIGAEIAMTSFPQIQGNYVEELSILIPKWDPRKNEAELLRWRGDVRVTGKYRIHFGLFFRDAGPLKVSVFDGLTLFCDKARAVIDGLESRCAEPIA